MHTAPVRILQQHRDTIRSLAFSPTNAILASLSIITDTRIILWDVATWTPLRQFPSGSGTTDIWFSPDGSTLIGTGISPEIRFWDVSTGQERIVATRDPSRGYVRFHDTNTGCLAVCHNDALLLYDLATQEVVKVVSPPHSFAPIVSHCGWLNTDATVLAIANTDYTLQLWDIHAEKTLFRLYGHQNTIIDVDFHPHEPVFASVSKDGTIFVWNMHTATARHTFRSAASDVLEVLLNPQLPLIAVVNGEEYIELWNIDLGACSATLAGHDAQIVAAFSPDGRILASGGDDFLLRIWAME